MQRQLDRIVAVLGEPGSAVLLLGRARSGKSQLAREIVESLERQPGAGRGTTVIPVPDPQSLHQFAARIDAAVQTAPMDADAPSPLLLLERVDLYDDAETVLLDRLRAAGRPGTGSGHRLRMLATAQSLLGGALAFSDSRTLQVTVAPLSLEEAEQQLITQLGGGQIDAATLQRWHAVSGGDHRALLLLLRANERSGTLRRRHGLAWVPAGEGVLPVEIVEEIEQECTEAERALLELIALAEPVAEPALLRLLDPALVGRLIADGRLRSSRLPDGRQALGLAIPLQGMVLRESMSPIRRMEYSARCFDALGATAATLETPEELNRRLIFGIEGGRAVPAAEIARAVAAAGHAADPRLLLRVADGLPHAAGADAAAAASLRAASASRLLGDAVALAAAHAASERLLTDPSTAAELSTALRTRLELSRAERHFAAGRDRRAVAAELDGIEQRLTADDQVSRESVRTSRTRLALFSGDYATVRALDSDDSPEGRILEWVRAPARSATALLRLQEGRIGEATRMAEEAYRINLLGRTPLSDTAEQQGFCWSLGYWVGGDLGMAAAALDEVDARCRAENPGGRSDGFIELGRALIGVSEARWSTALARTELLLEELASDDPHGIAPMAYAVNALACAALGESESAVVAMHRARRGERGISRALTGVRRRLLIQARQWMRISQVDREAFELARWARAQGLALVELQALHIVAMESKRNAGSVLEPVRQLAGIVDPSVAAVVLKHVEAMAEGTAPWDVSEPEVRMLADLGVWVPLPVTSGLSGREREVALLAALGYASKAIADRLHLSKRTVDAHLAKVYTKLDLADREALRRWFSADRSADRSVHEGGASER